MSLAKIGSVASGLVADNREGGNERSSSQRIGTSEQMSTRECNVHFVGMNIMKRGPFFMANIHAISWTRLDWTGWMDLT